MLRSMGPQTVREHRYDHHDRANCNHDQETTKLEETTRTTNMVCPKYLCIEDRMLPPSTGWIWEDAVARQKFFPQGIHCGSRTGAGLCSPKERRVS